MANGLVSAPASGVALPLVPDPERRLNASASRWPWAQPNLLVRGKGTVTHLPRGRGWAGGPSTFKI